MFVLIDFPIKISFEICSKQLLTMRNRFLILPKAEKVNFNEFLMFKVLKTDENIVFSTFWENEFLQYFKISHLKNWHWECQQTIPHGPKLLGAYFKTYFDWKIFGQPPK